MDADINTDDETDHETESEWDSEATADFQNAFYTLLDRFIGRVASYMMTDKIWGQLPDLITTYSWLEHHPLFKTGANYDNINVFKTRVGDLSAPMHQRHFVIRALTPADIISLLPVIIEDEERANDVFGSFPGILTRAQVRAFYYFVSMPEDVKQIFIRLPDMYKVCHEIVENAIEDKTAVSLLRANSMPAYLRPTMPLKRNGCRQTHKKAPRPPYKWTKKRADTLNEW